MKASLTLAILILIAGLIFCWQDAQRLAASRKQTSGILAVTEEDTQASTRASRQRLKPEVRAKFVLKGYLSWMDDHQKLREVDENTGIAAATEDRHLELMNQVRSLNADELKILIAESRTMKDVYGSPLHQTFISYVSQKKPALALGFVAEEADQGPGSLMTNGRFIEFAIGVWAKDDPTAALAWASKHKDKFPVNAIEEVNEALLREAGGRDPQTAFRLLGEMGDVEDGVEHVIYACRTPEQLSAALSGLPEYLKTIDDEKKKIGIQDLVMSRLAFSATNTGFESGKAWIESANLSAAASQGLIWSIGANSRNFKDEDVIKWADWVSRHSTTAENDKGMRHFIAGWTNNDYRAAGAWIMAAADGPIKNNSIRAYAETVSEYEPETAIQWAETLPKGPEQDATLKVIHKNWAKKNPVAAGRHQK